jgi:hypothetical protein
MQKVLAQYAEHISRVYTKAHTKQGGILTEAQKKGIAYYRAAAERVQALIDAPTPAWVLLQFTPKRRYVLPQPTVEI